MLNVGHGLFLHHQGFKVRLRLTIVFTPVDTPNRSMLNAKQHRAEERRQSDDE